MAQITALAYELPAMCGLPLSRLSCADIMRETQRHGLVARIGDRSVARWLHEVTRAGAWAYLAAFGVHRAEFSGHCEPSTRIGPFSGPVAQVMTHTLPGRTAHVLDHA